MASEDFSSEPTDEEVVHVLSRGRLGDFVFGFSLPAIALPGRPLYSVELHGSGISLPVEGSPTPIIGFYVVYHVRAATVRGAEETAIERLKDWWETFYQDTAGELQVEIEEAWDFDGWFSWRSRTGFAFYHPD